MELHHWTLFQLNILAQSTSHSLETRQWCRRRCLGTSKHAPGNERLADDDGSGRDCCRRGKIVSLCQRFLSSPADCTFCIKSGSTSYRTISTCKPLWLRRSHCGLATCLPPGLFRLRFRNEARGTATSASSQSDFRPRVPRNPDLPQLLAIELPLTFLLTLTTNDCDSILLPPPRIILAHFQNIHIIHRQ